MDILIPDSWLRDFLKTSATPKKIAQCLSLCGPSVEKIQNYKGEAVYLIEVTTNRVDSASIYGVAREAAAIIPRFGIKARLQPIKVLSKQKFTIQVNYLNAKVDVSLCPRFCAVLIKNIKIAPSPSWIRERLESIGARPINNVVDISNYLMYELGQPLHTFDYDKIAGKTMILRASKKGETVKTLDGKRHVLAGGDIVIEDGEGRLIDLAGIMGGQNSAVDQNTKNVLLFVQTYNPKNIRQTSMQLSARTYASSLFEKGLDNENVEITQRRAIDLFVSLCGGKPESEVLDIYPNPKSPKLLKTSFAFIKKYLGIEVSKKQISDILFALGFTPSWGKDILNVEIPSYRKGDIAIPEDIVEEVARIYGYHNLPSTLMTGIIPQPVHNPPFEFELKVKQILKGWGGVEVYTMSLVSSEKTDLPKTLRVKNPLGTDSWYLRTSLLPSLVAAAQENPTDTFHLFEMSNVYLPRKNNLPEERMLLAGVFAQIDYQNAKGIIEALFEELGVEVEFIPKDIYGFLPNKSVVVKAKKEKISFLGILENGFTVYEFNVEKLRELSRPHGYQPIPKYPPQLEDITFFAPRGIFLGKIIQELSKVDHRVTSVLLGASFQDTKTLRITYQDKTKTLTDKEVERIRKKLIRVANSKFGITAKQ